MKLIGLDKIKFELDNIPADNIPHIILSGTQGSGKTASAKYLAQTKGKTLIFLTGNTLTKRELILILMRIQEGDILLIDEIQSLDIKTEETLYNPMEFFELPLKTDNSFVRFRLPRFSVIGTTTKLGSISKPLITRFHLNLQIPEYTQKDLANIIKYKFPQVDISDCIQIARNVICPREALNLTERLLRLNMPIDEGIKFVGFEWGLSEHERKYLEVLKKHKSLSINSLGTYMKIDKSQISYLETKLISKDFIEITSKGRKLSAAGKTFCEEKLEV